MQTVKRMTVSIKDALDKRTDPFTGILKEHIEMKSSSFIKIIRCSWKDLGLYSSDKQIRDNTNSKWNSTSSMSNQL
jgi:hypothetical protein